MATEEAIARTISVMRGNIGEDLSLDDLARVALFSKFHFTRIFQRATGISPGRFLTALRIAEAKRLLRTTARTVADIGTSVGYTSVSTFSTRFNRGVGFTPVAYRRGVPHTPAPAPPMVTQGSTLSGRIVTTSPETTFVGLFPDPIAEGLPAHWTIASTPGTYHLTGIGPGTWHLIGYPFGAEENQFLGARTGPILAPRSPARLHLDVTLRPLVVTDPPAVLSYHRLGPQARDWHRSVA